MYMNKIINELKTNGRHSYNELAALYDDDSQFQDELAHLFNNGLIIEHYGKILLPEHLNLVRAEIVSVKQTFAFAAIEGEEEDVHLESHALNSALLGDLVFLERRRKNYAVYSIYKRVHEKVIGEIYHLGKNTYLQVNSLAPSDVAFELSDYEGEEEELVIAKINSYEGSKVRTSFLKSLGAKNAPGNDITRILIEENVPEVFPAEVDLQVSSIPYEISKAEIKNRQDLRDQLIVTIDGEEARDFDDAVSVRKTGSGYEIGVHIADVSYYVNEGSPIDLEAYERGTSIYVLDRVIPMLPFALSNGICSLKEGEDRLTISVIMNIDQYGQVRSSKILPSVIKSKGRLTYTYVQDVIERNKPENDIEKMLLLLDEVANKIRKNRIRRGAIDLDLGELHIKTNKEGKAIDVQLKKGIESENLIEDLMVLTNEVVAETITNKKLPMLYRIHEQPEGQRIDNLNYLLKRLGHRSDLNPKGVKPKDMQILVNKYKNEPEGPVIMEASLRSLAKARYAPINHGHFGLASTCYTHFTSPIRRYPDLIIHRLIRKYLFNNDKDIEGLKKYLTKAGEQTSDLERRAIKIERLVNDMKSAEFMETLVGETMHGMITGLANSGMFVQLDNGVSGLIRFDTMSDYYKVDEAGISARGRRSKVEYMLGERVEVVISAASKETSNIDLILKEEKKSKTRKKKETSGKSNRKNRTYRNTSRKGRKNRRKR